MKKWITGICAVLLLSSITAQAAELKIGFVDVKSAIENTMKYKDASSRLKALVSKIENELKTLKDRIQTVKSEINKGGMVWSPEKLQAKRDELTDLETSFKRKQEDGGNHVGRETRRLNEGVGEGLFNVIGQYAKDNGYDMILQKQPMVLYGQDQYDLTGEITKMLDARVK